MKNKRGIFSAKSKEANIIKPNPNPNFIPPVTNKMAFNLDHFGVPKNPNPPPMPEVKPPKPCSNEALYHILDIMNWKYDKNDRIPTSSDYVSAIKEVCKYYSVPFKNKIVEGENKYMKIEIWFKNTALPRKYDAINTFEEGHMFCIQVDGKIYKYPIMDIFRVVQLLDD